MMNSLSLDERGFTIPLVLVLVLVLGAALMATTTRAWLGYKGVIRQGQARSAREVAEAGSSLLIKDLNSNFSHLLVVNDDDWDNPTLVTGICSNDSSGSPSTTGAVGSTGRYTLKDYTFTGNPFFGGNGVIRVKGEIIGSDNSTISTSIIEQTIQIVSKPCTSPFNSPLNEFPGLLALRIDIANNDLLGTNANAICLQCNNAENIPYTCSVNSSTPLEDLTQSDKECLIKSKSNSVVDGEIYIGDLPVPPVPVAPVELNNVTPASIGENTTIVSGSTDTNELLDGACIVDSNNITQCLISDISLAGTKTLTIDTSTGSPVRIFVTGDITLTGLSSIEHIPTSAPAARVGLFGRPTDNDNSNDQEVSLNGGTKVDNIWTYFPDGLVEVNGGGNTGVSCSNGNCSGGNFHGAVWAKEWEGSSSNVATITVPADMGEEIENYYGISMGLSDYAALGISKWNNLITDTQ